MFGFLISALRRVLQCLLAAMLLMLYAPPKENQQENQVHQVQVRLAAAGRCYLGTLAGEQTVLWLQEVREERPLQLIRKKIKKEIQEHSRAMMIFFQKGNNQK